MKKILVATCALMLGVSAYAQGTLNASNAGAFGTAPIGNPDASPAGTETSVEVWAGTDANNLTLQISGAIVANGLFSLGSIAIDSVAPGDDATVVVRAWDTTSGATYDAALVRGESAAFTAGTGGVGSPASPPGDFANMASFNMTVVPEPSIIVLGLAGAGLLWFRRKK
jgi:hypothetical protein